jgi:S1-C subfamily serine protease
MTSARRSSFLSALLGAAVVGVVVVVLALTGVIDRTKTVEVPAASTPTQVATEPDAPAAPPSEPRSVASIYATVSPGVVFVQARGGNGQLSFEGPGGGRAASGSGFVIDDQGYIVTNDHVVEGANAYTVRFGDQGSKPITAKLVGKDPSTDVAVLKIDPKAVKGGLHPVELGTSKSLRPGDAAIAIGSPFGLSGTVTSGIISALNREIDSPNGFKISGAVQTDAAINPGNSGGPLLDEDGRVIGINSQIETGGSNANSGVGFAVPIDTVKQVVPQLKADGKIDRAYIGVATVDATSRDGATVDQITSGGPASSSDLRVGDKITALDGKPVRNPSDLGQLVLSKKPGEKAKLTVVRGSDTRTIEVKLGERPNTPVNP